MEMQDISKFLPQTKETTTEESQADSVGTPKKSTFVSVNSLADVSVSRDFITSSQATVLSHLLHILKLWWRHLTMRVHVPQADMDELQKSCQLEKREIVRLYKQFRLLVGDSFIDVLRVEDLETHSSLLAGNPMKKYIYRMLFWNQEQLTFVDFVKNLSLMLSNCIGCPHLHQVKSTAETAFFMRATGPKDVIQVQKLLALFDCFDLKENGALNTTSLGLLFYDLLRCDSDFSVSSLVPPSMMSRMVNAAIVRAHERFPGICEDICGPVEDREFNRGLQSVSPPESRKFSHEGHRMVLTKEIFVRDQENLHLDQLLAMRI